MEWWQMYPAAKAYRGRRIGLLARFRLWKRRRKQDDFGNLRGWSN